MNIALWIAVGIILLVALYMKLTQEKTSFNIIVYEEDGGKLIKHSKTYPGLIKTASNRSKTSSISWLFIGGLKKNYIIPQSKYFTYTTGKINKTLHLLWNGKNSFKVIKPVLNKFKYVVDVVDKKKYYKKVLMENVEFSMTDDDWEYIQSELNDSLEELYKEKDSLLKKLQPYYALAIVALVCIAGIYMIQKTAVQTSNDVKEQKNWIMDILESQKTRKVDDNTMITSEVKNVENKE